MDSPPIPFPSSMSKTQAKLLLVPCLCIILKPFFFMVLPVVTS